MSHKPNPTHPTPPSLPEQRRVQRSIDRDAEDKRQMADRKLLFVKSERALLKWAHVVKD